MVLCPNLDKKAEMLQNLVQLDFFWDQQRCVHPKKIYKKRLSGSIQICFSYFPMFSKNVPFSSFWLFFYRFFWHNFRHKCRFVKLSICEIFNFWKQKIMIFDQNFNFIRQFNLFITIFLMKTFLGENFKLPISGLKFWAQIRNFISDPISGLIFRPLFRPIFRSIFKIILGPVSGSF